MEPIVGASHDIVIHVNSTVRCGVICWPGSYRIGHMSGLLPRISEGDPTGQDTTLWSSFVQQSFFQGAGQYAWSSQHANGAFAESRLFDIGRPVTIDDVVLKYDPSWSYGTNLAPTGQLQVAVMPYAMTAADVFASRFTAQYPIFLLEMSQNPHIVHNTQAIVYTSHAQGRTWIAGLNSPSVTGLTGVWAKVSAFASMPSPVVSVTEYSGILAMASQDRLIRLWGPVRDTVSAGGPVTDTLNPVVYKPSWSTFADRLAVYDEKLWRAEAGRVAYYSPSDNTAPWSEYYSPHRVDIPINNICEFGGRLFFGYEDCLAVFDQGTVYIIQSFAQQRDSANFKLMINHYGALYFNIQGRLYRYTGAGVIELIRTPIFTNNIVSGVSLDDELIFIVAGAGVYQVWIYNADSGGVNMWFDKLRATDVDIPLAAADTPNFISALRGRVFIAPMYITGSVLPATTLKTPVLAVSRYPSTDARKFGGAQLTMSSLDMGRPSVDKQYNRIVVDHRMDAGSHIDVEVSVSPRQLPRLTGATGEEQLIAVNHSSAGSYVTPTNTSMGRFIALFQAAKILACTYRGFGPIGSYSISIRVIWGAIASSPCAVSLTEMSFDLLSMMLKALRPGPSAP